MSISLKPLDGNRYAGTSCYDLAVKPYKLGFENMINICSSDLSLKERVVVILTGPLLCVPLLNTIIYLILKCLLSTMGNNAEKSAPPIQNPTNPPALPPVPKKGCLKGSRGELREKRNVGFGEVRQRVLGKKSREINWNEDSLVRGL